MRQKEQQMQYELESQDLEGLTHINLRHLDPASLKRYKRHYRLRTKHTRPDDEELYAVVVRHFASSEVPSQDETLEAFLFNVKNEQRGNK
eukprot:TRINITY_DN7306_c0_g1_i2.p1 TRINITY_DN7306_c0_g1~~TRINITY_DN7306_c0_g1_i2.p1  ORF type:complete len:101 (+),score=4.21 TRINITY_DN7306_c0_g1_i2:36-305(+)